MNGYQSAGVLTFLFTDLEDSTRLWEAHPEAMRIGLARHDALLAEAVAPNQGRIVKSTGDGIHAVFESPVNAVSAALGVQQAMLCVKTVPIPPGPSSCAPDSIAEYLRRKEALLLLDNVEHVVRECAGQQLCRPQPAKGRAAG